MGTKNILIKILAIVGTLLALIPTVVPIFFSLVSLLKAGAFHFDYLMPAELSLFALGGGLLLLWAAIWAHSHVKWIAWSLGAAVVFLVGGQGLALLTGLATAQNEPTGWRLALVLGSIVAYSLALVAIGVGGILLCIHLFKRKTN